MPLDVQPLSKTRQAVMILVMFGLLAASLGVGQLLVKRQKPSVIIMATFPPPLGVKDLPVNDSGEQAFEGQLKRATATWKDGPRSFYAFSFDGPWEKHVPWQVCLDILFASMTGGLQAHTELPTMSALAGNVAMQRFIQVAGPEPHFAILRLTMIDNDHVVAFGFSGIGTLTENDRSFFDDYCTAKIRIQHVKP